MPKPNENLWLPDSLYTLDEVNALMEKAANVYAALGLTKQSGSNAGRGHIAMGLVKQAAGDLAVVKVPSDIKMNGKEMETLRQLAQKAQGSTLLLLTEIIAGLETAIQLRDETHAD